MNVTLKYLVLIMVFYVNGFTLPNSLRTEIMNTYKKLSIQKIDTLFELVKNDKYERRNFFTGISMKMDTSTQQARMAIPVVSNKIRQSIIESASDSDPFLSRDAMSAAGRMKISEIRDVAIDRAINAEKISVMYDSHIRQAALFALLETGDSTLNDVFKELLTKRCNHWFEGDLEMILKGLSNYGDNTALPELEKLYSQVAVFIGQCGSDEVYYRMRCEELRVRIEGTQRSISNRHSFINTK